MIQRIFTLTRYLITRLATSWIGGFYVALTLAYYGFAFRTRTPEADYFILVLGLFGAGISFFVAMTLASRANEGKSAPFFVRLESRVEYLLSVFLASFGVGLALQLCLMFVVLLRNDPQLTFGRALDIPPIWLSLNVLAILLAIHASDFVARGWSRIWIFGGIALLLMVGDYLGWFLTLLTDLIQDLANRSTSPSTVQDLNEAASWLSSTDASWSDGVAAVVRWPFEAIINGVLDGGFTATQAFAPALLIIYATVLFFLAAHWFANKDLYLLEE